MKFSKPTIYVLKNFATINPSIRLIPGNFVMTANQGATNYAEAEIEDTIDLDCAIYDLNGFLNILQLVDGDAEVTLEGNRIAITGPRSVVYWPTVDPSKILTPKARVNFPPATITFDLKSDDWQQFTRVARALGVDNIAILSKNKRIVLEGYNRLTDSNFEAPLTSLDLGELSMPNNFKFIISMANMKIPVDTYSVKIYAQGVNIATWFEGALSSHLIPVEKTTTHDFG